MRGRQHAARTPKNPKNLPKPPKKISLYKCEDLV